MGQVHKIMLVGKSGVGKDEFADALWGILSFNKFPVLKIGLADALKETVREMLVLCGLILALFLNSVILEFVDLTEMLLILNTENCC